MGRDTFLYENEACKMVTVKKKRLVLPQRKLDKLMNKAVLTLYLSE